jgi:hypothetical protein
MSAADITPQVKQQDDDLADDGLDIPGFLKITAVDRRHAWNRHPPTPVPAFGREMTETEVAYRASIARERAAKRAADEVRFQAMRARAASEKAERQAVQQAVKKRKHEGHRGVGRDRAGTRVARAK